MNGEWLHNMDDEGRTPLDRAFNSGHMAIAEMMLRQERADHEEVLHGATPLHRAAYLGLTEAVRALIRYGASAEMPDRELETPLHKAVREGHLETVRALLPHSNVNAISSLGMTPLHWACVTGSQEMVDLLVTHGADPWIRDDALDGLTAPEMARIMGYEDLAQYSTAKSCAA